MFVLTTPTGHIGSQLLTILLDSGAKVRAIARDPDKLEAHPDLEVVQGSTDDAEVLTRAFEGATGVFWCVPPPNRAPDVLAHYARFSEAAAQAVRAQDTMPLVVTVSNSSWVEAGAPAGADAISEGLRDMENTLNATGAPTCHLRNGFFMDNLLNMVPLLKAKGILSLPLPGDVPIALTATADIARVAAIELNRAPNGQTHRVLYGSWSDLDNVAALISAGAGREIAYQKSDLEQAGQMLLQHGASPAFVNSYLAMSRAMDEGLNHWADQSADPDAMTIEEFVNREIVPAL